MQHLALAPLDGVRGAMGRPSYGIDAVTLAFAAVLAAASCC